MFIFLIYYNLLFRIFFIYAEKKHLINKKLVNLFLAGSKKSYLKTYV
jgi:hypothetical protein